MKKPRRLIVFDIDDTLYLERDFVRSGFKAVEARCRLKGFSAAAWKKFLAGRRGYIFNEVLAEKGIRLTARLVRRLVSIYRTHRPKVKLCSDARRFLTARPDGVALAVLSDGPIDAQRAKVGALGLRKLVQAVVLTGQWGRRYGKPHPRGFRFLERKFGVSGDRCVYVGDNPRKDFDAPRALGWKVFRVRRRGGLHERVASPGIPEIRSCDDLRNLLTP